MDKDFKVYCRVVYANHLKKRKIYAAHKELSRALNEMGESGYTLPEAVESVFSIWFRYGAIRPTFLETWMHTGIVNEDAPFPPWLPE